MNWYKYSKSKYSPYLKYTPLLAIPASIPMWISDGNSNKKNIEQNQYDKIIEPSYSIPYNSYKDKQQNNQIEQSTIENNKNNTPSKNIQEETKKDTAIEQNPIVTVEEMFPIISLNEGKSNIAYEDSLGYKTIAIGFCLEPSIRKDAKEKIESVGGNYERIYNKEESLSDNQIYYLTKQDIENAIRIANSFCGDLSSHPKNVQKAIVDMAFNLGPNRLGKFVKLQDSLKRKDYANAAKEMKDSKWFKQIGNRGPRMIDYMLGKNN